MKIMKGVCVFNLVTIVAGGPSSYIDCIVLPLIAKCNPWKTGVRSLIIPFRRIYKQSVTQPFYGPVRLLEGLAVRT